MPNSVQHSGTAIDNALGIGDLYMGVPASGPTSVSGFYTGINPPSGGYTVYMNKGEGGPSIVCPANDAALIAFTQNLTGESMADVNACFAYFAGETDKMVMHNPISEMHLADLQLYLIAGVIPSYPRSGTSWKDLSGNARNGTFTNGPTFNSNGWIEFDGVDDDIRAYGAGISDYSQAFSMSVLFKIASGATWDNGFKSNIVGVNGGYAGMYGIYKDDDDEFGVQLRDSNSTITTTCSGNVVDKWYKLTATWDGSTTLKLYRNGELVSTNNTGGITGSPDTTNLHIAGSRAFGGNTGNVFEGDIANCTYYTKLLSDSDILTNYYQGPIVTSGLIRALDFSNLVCYESGDSDGSDLTGNDTFDLFNSPTFTSNFGGGIICEETDEFIALDDVTATDYVSVECWYTKDSEGAGEDIVWNKESCWELNDNNGNLSWAVLASNQGWFWYDTGVDIAIGETAHFVLTYDGNYVRFYKNGVLESTYTYPSGGVLANQNSCYPKLNSRNCTRTTVQNPGDHTFYQFRIYNRAITDGEVQQNYNATVNKFN